MCWHPYLRNNERIKTASWPLSCHTPALIQTFYYNNHIEKTIITFPRWHFQCVCSFRSLLQQHITHYILSCTFLASLHLHKSWIDSLVFISILTSAAETHTNVTLSFSLSLFISHIQNFPESLVKKSVCACVCVMWCVVVVGRSRSVWISWGPQLHSLWMMNLDQADAAAR